MNEEQRKRRSKFLALILRHQPESVGLTLEKEGWASIDAVLTACRNRGRGMSRADLDALVAADEKGRYSFDATGTKIRANQGHSTGEVELTFTKADPPAVLYHGTVDRFLPAIFEQGLIPGSRHHVHLSADKETAMKVGQRRGKPMLLEIDARRMVAEGGEFFVSDNGVWLAARVAPTYLSHE
jgi:putative RNA 2'-phosphotransferase